MEDQYEKRISEMSEKLSALLSKKPEAIDNIIKNKERFNFEGVYLISTPNDKKIIYAGKTKSKTIYGRIKDHHGTDTNSDLKGMLKRNQNLPQNTRGYIVRCIEIKDPRKRGFFEDFMVGVLQPELNKVEN